MFKVAFVTLSGDPIMTCAVTAIPEVEEVVTIDQEMFMVRERRWAYVNPDNGRETFGMRKPVEPNITIRLVKI